MLLVSKRFLKGAFLLLLLVMPAIFSESAHADEKEAPAGFTVESILPENQIDKTKTFFYLNGEPDSSQVIQVRVKSLQKEPVTVKLAAHDAISSSVGAINYAQIKPKLDKSLKDPVTSLVKIEDGQKEITVTDFEEKIVSYKITLPKKAFPGVKLGSLRFLKKETSKKKQEGVASEYAYVIALMLTEDEEAFDHGADLHLKKVGLQLSNGRKVIAARIQNDQPKVLQKMKIKGTVKRKGSNDVIESHEMSDFSVAPNSNFDFEIPLGIENFKSGTYLFEGEAKGDGRTWKWKEEFVIGKDTADKVNEEAAYRLRVPQWVPWITAGLLIGLIGLVAYLMNRQKKWQNEGK